MKFRNKLVSNSSTSSFIVSNMTLNELVINMFRVLRSDGYHSSEIKKWTNRLKKKPPQVGVRFPSCNYDTYILNIKDINYVSTCWNHNWNYEIDYQNYNEERMNKKMQKHLFFDLDTGKVHSNERFFKSWKKDYICPNCNKVMFCYYLNESGKKICSECGEVFSKAKTRKAKEI